MSQRLAHALSIVEDVVHIMESLQPLSDVRLRMRATTTLVICATSTFAICALCRHAGVARSTSQKPSAQLLILTCTTPIALVLERGASCLIEERLAFVPSRLPSPGIVQCRLLIVLV